MGRETFRAESGSETLWLRRWYVGSSMPSRMLCRTWRFSSLSHFPESDSWVVFSHVEWCQGRMRVIAIYGSQLPWEWFALQRYYMSAQLYA